MTSQSQCYAVPPSLFIGAKILKHFCFCSQVAIDSLSARYQAGNYSCHPDNLHPATISLHVLSKVITISTIRIIIMITIGIIKTVTIIMT